MDRGEVPATADCSGADCRTKARDFNGGVLGLHVVRREPATDDATDFDFERWVRIGFGPSGRQRGLYRKLACWRLPNVTVGRNATAAPENFSVCMPS